MTLNQNDKKRKSLELFSKLKAERKEYLKNHSTIKGYRKSKMWHAILLPLLKLLRIVNMQNIHIIGDKHINTSRPTLYACTHIGFFDVMILFEVIKKPCWLFWGNPNEDLITLFGWMALKNGTILIDSYDKEDRKCAKQEAEMLLNQGGSLMIFPEGAWNITDNEPVMRLFPGTVSLALNTGAEIIPIAIDQYGKDFYVNIGENIHYKHEDWDIDILNSKLRDTLATLKYQIWEQQPTAVRSELHSNYRDIFVKKIFEDAGGKYTPQMVENERYHDRKSVSKEEVFSYLRKINYR